MFSAVYFIMLVLLASLVLKDALKLRGGPKDYSRSDSNPDEGMGAKAYHLLRQRSNIDNIHDHQAKYIALMDWNDEADAFNLQCEKNFSNNLFELPKRHR